MENTQNYSNARRLLPYLFRFKWRIVLALIFVIGSKVLSVADPYIIKKLIDTLTEGNASEQVRVLFGLVALFFALRAGATLLDGAKEYTQTRVLNVLKRVVSLDVFGRLLELSADYHTNRSTGALSRKISRGTQGIDVLIWFSTMNIIPTALEMILILSVFLLSFPPSFGLVFIGTIVIYIAYTIITTNRRQKLLLEVNKLDDAASGRSIDAVLNYDTVKYFSNEAYEHELYDKGLTVWQEQSIRADKSGANLNMGQALIVTIGLTVLLVLSLSEFLAGRATVGDFVLVTTYLARIAIPLNFLGFMYRRMKEALASVDEMMQILSEKSSVKDTPGAQVLQEIHGAVEFEHVSFGYNAERTILHDVSLLIPAGKRTAIVGYSGSGKSTISKLLLRFYDVHAGKVSIDGIDVRDVTQASLRAHIGVVAQDTILFNDTIRANISYGKPGATQEEIEAAARTANIHDFIVKDLPQGYDTVVGERGVKLSGGEKQRVAIARMLIKNPKILLFDEATASLDSKAEKTIQEAIEKISGHGRTTIVIAHRLSTIVDFDKIIVLEAGKKVEEGTHNELIEKGGTYHKLWTIQHDRKEATVDGDQGATPA